MPELINIHYSPWSEKARWALDLRRIEYRSTEYVPMLSEPSVRLRTRKLVGRITVPILVADGEILDDSFEIARWAERHGSGPSLFPDGSTDEVARWNERSERLMAGGRALVTGRVSHNADALRDSVPRVVRSMGIGRAMGALGARHLARKYDIEEKNEDEHREAMRGVLTDVRGVISAASGDYVLGQLSYADVALAAALQFVRPVADRFLELSPANREAWTDPVLSKEFGDLLEWRDRLYEEHR